MTRIKTVSRVLAPLLCAAFVLGACSDGSSAEKYYKKTAPAVPEYNLNAAPMKYLGTQVPEGYAFWLAEAENLKALAAEDDPFLSITGDSADYAEVTAPAMQGLYAAYCATLDPEYLTLYAAICQNTLGALEDRDNDGYPGWGTDRYKINQNAYFEYAAHTGAVVKGWGDFALLVMSDPGLSGLEYAPGQTLGGLAALLVKTANEELLPSFDKDFSKNLMLYKNRSESVNYGAEAGDFVLPHSQYLTMASALYSMALVSPEYAGKYVTRADAMLAAFASFVRRYEDKKLSWNYSDTFHREDYYTSDPENYADAAHDYRAAVLNYNRGGLFDYDAMNRFAVNLQKHMFNGDYNSPGVSEFVSGSGVSSVDNLPGSYGIMLSRYAAAVWQICAKAWQGSAPDAALLLQLHPESPAPESFLLTAPSGGSAITPDGAVFLWTPSKYAADYLLEISEKSDFLQKAVDRPYISENAAYVDSLKPGTEYYWRVTARSASGLTLASETLRFETAQAAPKEKRSLSFDYMAQKGDIPKAGKLSLRVYANRILAYETQIKNDGKWHGISLDLTEFTGSSSEATFRIEFYSASAKPYEAQICIDNIALSGSPDPVMDFTPANDDPVDESVTGYSWGAPDYYARQNKSRIEDGVLLLRIPSDNNLDFLEDYIDPYYDFVSAHFDIGFSLQAKD